MEVIITGVGQQFTQNFYFIREVNGKRYFAKPVELIFEEKQAGQIIDPTMTLQYRDGEDFKKAMAEALDKDGVKTDNDHKVKGLLEATKFHLEDMRTLVFKKDKK